jgi:hypothetical protein
MQITGLLSDRTLILMRQQLINGGNKLLVREKKSVAYMVEIFCKEHHQTDGGLCAECAKTKRCIFVRLENCPFQEKKTACGRCDLQCYPPVLKEKVWTVLSYAGPKMALSHPILACYHLWDARRKPHKLQRK